ncbi:MAG: hypothetical protein ACLS7Z_09860 [Christensenellales bacterium]
MEDVRERYRLYLLTPPKKRHHRLNMEEVEKAEKARGITPYQSKKKATEAKIICPSCFFIDGFRTRREGVTGRT